MAGVVRRDGLREAVTALRDEIDNGRYLDLAEIATELSALLDAVPDVPPTDPVLSLMGVPDDQDDDFSDLYVDDDEPDPLCVKHGDNPTDGVCTCAVPDVPPDTPAADRDEAEPAPFAPAPDLVGRPRVYRAETEGVGRLVGGHEPECIGLNRDDDLAGQCDCRTIRMLVIEVLRRHLFDETTRGDALEMRSSGVLVDAADVRARAQEAAWGEGYASGVSDEAKSQDWTDGKVPPARANPYRRAVSEREGTT